jgi:polyphosphate glucokinase
MTILGIDIGGTGIKGAPVNIATGALVAERFRIATPKPAFPNAVAEVVGQIATHFNYKGPAGVTFPGIVKNNTIHSAANVDHSWLQVDAAKLFKRHLGCPGHGKTGVVIMLTFGTGIGSAIFHDGVLIPNAELGHLQLRGKDAEKRCSERVREEKDMSFKKWAKIVSEYLATLETLFSPELFIIGGGISKKADKFLPYLTAKTDVLIQPAKMQNDAGIIGAAFLAKIPA